MTQTKYFYRRLFTCISMAMLVFITIYVMAFMDVERIKAAETYLIFISGFFSTIVFGYLGLKAMVKE